MKNNLVKIGKIYCTVLNKCPAANTIVPTFSQLISTAYFSYTMTGPNTCYKLPKYKKIIFKPKLNCWPTQFYNIFLYCTTYLIIVNRVIHQACSPPSHFLPESVISTILLNNQISMQFKECPHTIQTSLLQMRTLLFILNC